MIFPLPSIWFGSPTDDQVALRVDRFEDAKRHRMAVGLYVNQDFSEIHGSLLIVSGHGKYLQTRSWSSDKIAISEALSERLQKLTSDPNPNLVELSSSSADLAVLQSQLIVRLKEKAGKYVDRILAVCVTDPGLWLQDFDGQQIYHSLCDPNKLAELTGLNVIDSFPARDVASGGNARWLDALPVWLMLADRDQKEARSSRLAMLIGETSELFFLPASDGLDSELPAILTKQLCGKALFEKLASRAGGKNFNLEDEKRLELATLNGRSEKTLVEAWSKVNFEGNPTATQELEAIANQSNVKDLPSLFRSSIVFCADQVLQWIAQLHPTPPLGQITIWGQSTFAKLLANELSNRVSALSPSPEVNTTNSCSEIRATLAGMQGFLTIDQMPGNLPWLTGCKTPQLLGRITSGRPTSWKQLLVEMADYRPPVMKLKDAV